MSAVWSSVRVKPEWARIRRVRGAVWGDGREREEEEEFDSEFGGREKIVKG